MRNRRSPRKKGYDYTASGAYFLTICTKNRKHYFGTVVDGKMILNPLGSIVHRYRHTIPDHFPHVLLDTFVVMPNHVHGIIVMGEINNIQSKRSIGKDDALHHPDRDKAMPLSLPVSNQNITQHAMLKKGISPKPGSLSVVIGSYKSICTKMIRRECDSSFQRQGRYHDHIIRNENSYQRIAHYIQNNPKNWNDDRFF